MSSKFVSIIVITVSLSILSGNTFAQTSVEPQPQNAEEELRAKRELDVKIKFCRQLMLDRNWAGAADMLEMLYEGHPDNTVVVSLLVQCNDHLQLYHKSEEIIRRHLTRYPDNFNFRLLYAEVLAKRGEFEKSARAYRDAAIGIDLSNRVRYQLIAQSMVTHGLDDAVLSFIDSLRVETGDSALFALQRGTVLERQRLYDVAAKEFYSLLDDTTALGNSAEKKLLALLTFVESEPQAENFLLGQPDLDQKPRALKILSSHYLKSGHYEKAFDFTISQDSLGGFSGRNLENFMRSCYDHRLYDQTVRTGEYLFGRDGAEGVRDDVYFIYADALVRLGKYSEAIDILGSVHDLTRQKRFKGEALYEIGRVYLDNLRGYDTALMYFDSVMGYYGGSRSYLQAMVSRPQCFLRQGKLDKARTELVKNASRKLEPRYLEQTLFDLALVDLFRMELDSSKISLNRLLVETPRGMYVNDVVRLLYTLEKAGGDREMLGDYSEALFFLERQMIDSAQAKLRQIADIEGSGLGDVALYELAQLSIGGADTAGAVEFVDRLDSEYPDSYYLPYGLRMKGDLFSQTVDKQQQAREIYRYILENFPNFPFISDVRQKVRLLEESLGSS